jgi:hypothetical protein
VSITVICNTPERGRFILKWVEEMVKVVEMETEETEREEACTAMRVDGRESGERREGGDGVDARGNT